MYSISQIAPVINAAILQQYDDAAIEHLLLDSRKLLFPKTSLFFALGGPRRSGSSFITELYDKGVRSFVVDEKITASTLKKFSDANFLQVKNVLTALQQLAAQHRKQFTYPVIGITGSNGKTIVKEWLYQLLHHNYNIVRSPKSYNSQIGVPLSVWQMNNHHELGIFEAGISLTNEMQQLEKIIAPSIGIFTNIGEAHSEGFETIKQKVAEKILLFKNTHLVIYCKDELLVDEAMQQLHNENNNAVIYLGQ